MRPLSRPVRITLISISVALFVITWLWLVLPCLILALLIVQKGMEVIRHVQGWGGRGHDAPDEPGRGLCAPYGPN